MGGGILVLRRQGWEKKERRTPKKAKGGLRAAQSREEECRQDTKAQAEKSTVHVEWGAW